jgi:hypothetical protein
MDPGLAAQLAGFREARRELEASVLPLATSVDGRRFSGQSGSGKTYSLGVILERLLTETGLRLVILDPNSDFVRLGTVRGSTDPVLAGRYRQPARGVTVLSADAPGERRLRIHAAELDPATQAAVLRLDPIADREEYAELAGLLARPGSSALEALPGRRFRPSRRCCASARGSPRRVAPTCPPHGLTPGEGYCRMLTARAITSPRMAREPVACMVIAALAQRARGITSVGLNAVALVKPR